MVRQMSDWINNACVLCYRVRPIILTLLGSIILTFSAYGMFLLYSWWYDTGAVLEFKGGEASKDSAYPNEVMVFHLNVHKLRNCEGRVRLVMTGECGHHVIQERTGVMTAGFDGRLTLIGQVPHTAIPGQCGFKVHIRYVCNPFDWLLSRQVYESPLIPFRVKDWRE